MAEEQHLHVFNIPACWNPNSIFSYFGPTFALISLLPLTMVFVSLLLIYKGDKIKMIVLFIYTHILLYVCHVAQKIIKDPRPYPKCSSFLISEYGSPSPELVYTVAIATKILFYAIWTSGTIWKCKLKVAGVLISIFVYGLSYYLGYLSSFKQIVVSVIIGVGLTIFVCWFLEKTLFWELRQIKNKTWRKCFKQFYSHN